MFLTKLYMKTTLLTTSLLMAASVLCAAQVQRAVCDETCSFESQATESRETVNTVTSEVGYAVVSPVGRGTVEMIKQAPRLKTLEGKTIALVGVSFMTKITQAEIKRLILAEYPKAKVILQDEIAYCGVFPAPGVRRKSNEEFRVALKEMGVDAVISGNGGCGLCTPKETGACITAEYMGIPSVLIAGPGFVDQAYYTALNNGVPALRVAEYPGAFASHTPEELTRNTREILWPQIKKALLTDITAEEIARNDSRSRGDIRDDIYYGTLEDVNEYFQSMNWSDGLPIVPPTFEKVQEFMRFSPVSYDETVAVLPVAHRNTTAWHVAVNGVMAGCKPQYMPILIAMTKAMGDPAFRRTLASTHAWNPFCWLNGPLAAQLGFDKGQGQINEAANAALGRFMNLALMNLAGYYVKQDRMGTFGYLMPWAMVEDEEACRRVGWEPYHVRQGFKAEDSTITLASTLMWGNNMAPSTLDPEKIMELLAWDISERCQFALGSGKQFTFRTVLMTEPVAKILASKYKTPQALEKKLITESRRPLKERAFANYYANPGGTKDGGEHNLRQYTKHLSDTEDAKETKTPAWYDSSESTMTTIPTMRMGMTAFLITGDSARNKMQTMPGGGFATVKIELPSNWDELIRNLDL